MEEFYVPIDMNGLEIRNHRLHLLASDPASPNEGDLWWNTTDHVARVRDNSEVRNLFSPDDDFYNRLAAKTSIADADEILLADSEDTYSYKRMTKANLVAGLSIINDAYTTIYPDAGISPLTASGASLLRLYADGTILSMVGSQPAGDNQIDLTWENQAINLVLASPDSGLAGPPVFRVLVDDDMPTSYNPTDWNTAYSHSQQTTGNPHNISLADIGYDGTIQADINVVLSNGKNFGKYFNGETIPSAGMTFEELINDIAIEYIDPAFSYFNISGQATTVEVGTTLSGSKTFNWSINAGTGVVNVIDIYDITDSSYIVTDTANDGTHIDTIVTNQLNSNGASQSWRGIGTDVNPEPDVDFNSSPFTVTARYYRFYGPSATSPTDSASVRALPTDAFQTGSIQAFALYTGTTEIKFVIALPPGIGIASVIDETALFADITSEYVKQTNINVLDAGGTNRSYEIYEMNIALAYSDTHLHRVTTEVL